MTDYSTLVTSEHNQQPNYMALVRLLANPFSDIAALVDSFPGLYDLDAALGTQLDATGKWIGQGRQVTGILAPGFFGYSDDSSALGFGELGQPNVGGRFIELSDPTTASAILSDPEFRQLLRARILQNQWNGTVGAFESALASVVNINNTGAPLVPQVFDPGSLVVSILLSNQPGLPIDPVAFALLTQYDILPRAAGVRYEYLQPQAGPTWATVGTATVVNNGSNPQSVQKLTGVAAWDSSAFIASPTPAMYLSWQVPNTTETFMGGAAANPSGSPNYPSLNYGLYCASGQWQIYESGAQKVVGSAYVAGDTFAVIVDQKKATYWRNNVLLYTSLVAPTGIYEPMFCIYAPVAASNAANNILFATGN